MPPLSPFASDFEPDFNDVHISAKIDFIQLFSPIHTGLKKVVGKIYIKDLQEQGQTGQLITIHDFEQSDIEELSKYFTDCRLDAVQINAVEISVDFRPRSRLRKTELDVQVECWRRWLIMHVYPWDAPGIQEAYRVVRKSIGSVKGARPETLGIFGDVGSNYAERIAGYNETFYLGHRDKIYADPNADNFAQLKIYGKRKDHNRALLCKKWSARIEVTLNKGGCSHFQLHKLEDISRLNFRRVLSRYFRMVTPEIKDAPEEGAETLITKVRQWRVKTTRRWLAEVGAYVLHKHGTAIIDRYHRHVKANERIGDELNNLSRKFKSCTHGV